MQDTLVSTPETTLAIPVEIPLDTPENTPESTKEGAEPAQSSLLTIDKKRLEEQLGALKRKELELRRAIAIADHPALADAIRLLEGRAYALTRAEGKIAQGLSKSEERRKDTLEKKLELLRAKRAELDAQIAELAGEHTSLVDARTAQLEGERQAALHELVACLGEHAAALSVAGLDAGELVPDIGLRMEQIRAAAEQLASKRS